MRKHIVLLGDSIFDNAVYVPGEDAVIDQLRAEIPPEWRATLVAVDGDITVDVSEQLKQSPADATDFVVSVGGNDALGQARLLKQSTSADDLPALLDVILPSFRSEYAAMLDAALQYDRALFVCTIYDQCPFPDPRWRQLVPIALNSFNECIIEEAEQRFVPIIELRDICRAVEDYSKLSPIEPSSAGGQKIVSAIIQKLSV